jgi:transcription initiation factor TFIID TATA-box-binding protein
MTETPPVLDSLQVQNVVASTEIDQQLALQQVANDLPGAAYTVNPGPTLTYQTADAPATVRCFRSGSLLAMGAPSRAAAHASLTQFLAHLRDLGIPVPETPAITILNMVFTADLDETLNLPAVAVALGLDRTNYEPEQFSGLIYRPADLAVVVLVFGSGKLVITGATEPVLAETALTTVTERLTALGL